MKKHNIIYLIAIFAFILNGFAVNSLAQTDQPPKKSEKPLPNLILNTIDGKKWNLYEKRGSVIVMNFWATWCAPCREETPMLVKLSHEYKSRGLEMVGIALDEDGTDLIKKFVADYKVKYPILLPVPGSLLSQIEPVPTTLLIDAEGRLAKKYVGVIPEKLLRADIEKLTPKKIIKKAADQTEKIK